MCHVTSKAARRGGGGPQEVKKTPFKFTVTKRSDLTNLRITLFLCKSILRHQKKRVPYEKDLDKKP